MQRRKKRVEIQMNTNFTPWETLRDFSKYCNRISRCGNS
jgi:hypothetical protein